MGFVKTINNAKLSALLNICKDAEVDITARVFCLVLRMHVCVRMPQEIWAHVTTCVLRIRLKDDIKRCTFTKFSSTRSWP
jgi:hypothetical protein